MNIIITYTTGKLTNGWFMVLLKLIHYTTPNNFSLVLQIAMLIFVKKKKFMVCRNSDFWP